MWPLPVDLLLKCVNVRADHPQDKFANETGRSWTLCYEKKRLGSILISSP